jgi:hypothetical protein
MKISSLIPLISPPFVTSSRNQSSSLNEYRDTISQADTNNARDISHIMSAMDENDARGTTIGDSDHVRRNTFSSSVQRKLTAVYFAG